MTALEIREARPQDIGRFVRRMRREHAQALATKGISVHHAMRLTYYASFLSRVAFLGGEPFAIWGCVGHFLSPFGLVWLVTTEMGTKHPLLLVKETRRQLNEMMVTKAQLLTTVADGDEAAMRFAAFLGFHVSHEIEGRPAFSRAGRHRLVKHATEVPDYRLPLGTGFAVRMGYHAEVPICA